MQVALCQIVCPPFSGPPHPRPPTHFLVECGGHDWRGVTSGRMGDVGWCKIWGRGATWTWWRKSTGWVCQSGVGLWIVLYSFTITHLPNPTNQHSPTHHHPPTNIHPCTHISTAPSRHWPPPSCSPQPTPVYRRTNHLDTNNLMH